MPQKIGLIKEGKIPQDHRVALTPHQCQKLINDFPGLTIEVESSPFRCFEDSEYEAYGIPVKEDLGDCDLLLGIKEVPVEQLISGKTYMFFSHTTKMQAQNQNMLRAILEKNIRLIDYELLRDQEGSRLLGFGNYAGIVGAHYALMMYGKRTQTFELPPAHEFTDYQSLKHAYSQINFPPFKIVIAGSGRVGEGAQTLLTHAGIQEVSPKEFREKEFETPVFTLLTPEELYERKDGQPFAMKDFKNNPRAYKSCFSIYAQSADVLINAVYWDADIPRHFQVEKTANPKFNIKTISDVSCDIRGAVPITVQNSFQKNPFYGFDPASHDLTPPFQANTIDIMAIDNLPNELPKDASQSFGEVLLNSILPEFLQNPDQPLFQKATITENGNLTKPFAYLASFAGIQ